TRSKRDWSSDVCSSDLLRCVHSERCRNCIHGCKRYAASTPTTRPSKQKKCRKSTRTPRCVRWQAACRCWRRSQCLLGCSTFCVPLTAPSQLQAALDTQRVSQCPLR